MFNNSLQGIKKIVCYFTCSCVAAVVDYFVTISLFSFFHVNNIIANTIGIIIGFFISFFLSSKTVFNTNIDLRSFLVFFGTFIIGLIVADTVMYVSCDLYGLSISIGKLLSMSLPFFITYYLRAFAYRSIKDLRYGEQ